MLLCMSSLPMATLSLGHATHIEVKVALQEYIARGLV